MAISTDGRQGDNVCVKPHDLSADAAGVTTLLDAAAIAGGVQALARRLRVPQKQLTSWMEGDEPTPPPVYLRAVDFIRVRG
jgi:hypothetical protein